MAIPDGLAIQGILSGLLRVVYVSAAVTGCFPARRSYAGFVYIIFCDLETSDRVGLSWILAVQQQKKKKVKEFCNFNIICTE